MKHPVIFAAITLFFINQMACTNSSPDQKENEKVMSASDAHLGEHMGQMQYYIVKLGLSLQNKNQPLASFYIQEVSETYADLVSMNIVDDTIHISEMLNQLLYPQIKNVQSVIEKNDTAQFISSYHTLIETCNNCHHEANHPFIVIEEPKENFNGQNFSAQAK